MSLTRLLPSNAISTITTHIERFNHYFILNHDNLHTKIHCIYILASLNNAKQNKNFGKKAQKQEKFFRHIFFLALDFHFAFILYKFSFRFVEHLIR